MGDVIRTVAACLALATWASAASSEELTEAELVIPDDLGEFRFRA